MPGLPRADAGMVRNRINASGMKQGLFRDDRIQMFRFGQKQFQLTEM